MTPGVYALLVLAAVDPHEATVIAQVMLQSSVDTTLEEGSRGAASRLEAGSHHQGAHKGGQVGIDPCHPHLGQQGGERGEGRGQEGPQLPCANLVFSTGW